MSETDDCFCCGCVFQCSCVNLLRGIWQCISLQFVSSLLSMQRSPLGSPSCVPYLPMAFDLLPLWS